MLANIPILGNVVLYIVHSECVSNIHAHTHTHKQTTKHRVGRKSRRTSVRSLFLCTFYLSKFICWWMCPNSHIYLSIYLFIYLSARFFCQNNSESIERTTGSTPTLSRYAQRKNCRGKAISHDRYLFCVLSNHIRSALVACVANVKDEYTAVLIVICSLSSISRFARAWVRVRVRVCVFYFVIPCACIAYNITTERTHALCVICVKHLAQAQHFKNKAN